MLGRGFVQRPASSDAEAAGEHARRAFAASSDVEIDVDAPKARPNGSFAGSDLAGALRASGPNRALAGSLGHESTAEGTVDARFGMVALVDASREVSPVGSDATWAPRAGGGADGLYAGAALGDGVGVSGLGIGAARDGLGVGLGSTGARGLAGNVPGAFASEPTWNSASWHGGWTTGYARVHRPPPGPHITHPARLSPMGPLDGAVVVRIVRRQNDALLRCYRKALETHADLAGGLRVDFMTDRSGSVVAAKDGGGSVAYDYALVTCMTKAFAAFAFPESAAFTRVAYAMELHPS
jgi:hypothetical protein